jgi:hypothetical protein
MPQTVTIPDELADRLRPYQAEIPEILELGISAREARAQGAYSDLRDILDTLANLPSPEVVLALRPTAALQARMEHLLGQNRTTGLSAEEQREWERYEYAEHLVGIAKARALLRVKGLEAP